jgi:hypothetical protein
MKFSMAWNAAMAKLHRLVISMPALLKTEQTRTLKATSAIDLVLDLMNADVFADLSRSR